MGAFSSLISIEKNDPISNSLAMPGAMGRFFIRLWEPSQNFVKETAKDVPFLNRFLKFMFAFICK